MFLVDCFQGSPGIKETGIPRVVAGNHALQTLNPLPTVLGDSGPGDCARGFASNITLSSTQHQNQCRNVLCRRFTLFPRLRATADLLMMPKEVLADRGIRNEVVPSLSVPRIRAILLRFRPDDYAPDPLPHGELGVINCR